MQGAGVADKLGQLLMHLGLVQLKAATLGIEGGLLLLDLDDQVGRGVDARAGGLDALQLQAVVLAARRVQVQAALLQDLQLPLEALQFDLTGINYRLNCYHRHDRTAGAGIVWRNIQHCLLCARCASSIEADLEEAEPLLHGGQDLVLQLLADLIRDARQAAHMHAVLHILILRAHNRRLGGNGLARAWVGVKNAWQRRAQRLVRLRQHPCASTQVLYNDFIICLATGKRTSER